MCFVVSDTIYKLPYWCIISVSWIFGMFMTLTAAFIEDGNRIWGYVCVATFPPISIWGLYHIFMKVELYTLPHAAIVYAVWTCFTYLLMLYLVEPSGRVSIGIINFVLICIIAGLMLGTVLFKREKVVGIVVAGPHPQAAAAAAAEEIPLDVVANNHHADAV